MKLYNTQQQPIADIDLNWPDRYNHLSVLRVAIEEPLPMSCIMRDCDDVEHYSLKTLGFMRFEDGVMLVEGSLDDLDFDLAVPQRGFLV